MTTDVKLADRPRWKKRALGDGHHRPPCRLGPTDRDASPDARLHPHRRSTLGHDVVVPVPRRTPRRALAAAPQVAALVRRPLRPERGVDRAHFPLSLPGRPRTWLTGEAAPYYLFHPAVPQRIASFAPRARLIRVLPEPGDRAWSHYQHERAADTSRCPSRLRSMPRSNVWRPSSIRSTTGTSSGTTTAITPTSAAACTRTNWRATARLPGPPDPRPDERRTAPRHPGDRGSSHRLPRPRSSGVDVDDAPQRPQLRTYRSTCTERLTERSRSRTGDWRHCSNVRSSGRSRS